MTTQDDKPLTGIRVIEFSQMVAAPSAAMMLADYGADVVKVEPPDGDNVRQLRSAVALDLPLSPIFIAYNRGKRLLRLDLRKPADLDNAKRLIAAADVMIEASLPGAMERLGLGPADVHAFNPRLVYGSVSGFGWSAGVRDKRGVDLIVQAESGIMAATGPLETPMKVGFTVVDAASGHAFCHALLAALFKRERSGRGAVVRVSLYDVALHLQAGPLVEYLMTGTQLPRNGNSAPLGAPADLLRCGEGAIVIAAYLPKHWQNLLHELNATELADDPRFRTPSDRITHRPALIAALEARLASASASTWEARFSAVGLLVGQVQDYAAVTRSPYALAAGAIAAAGDAYGVHNPALFDDQPRGALAPHRECAVEDIEWLNPNGK
ncbi:MAG: CoA transferase [Gammaproteobacteria bacterium]|nr:CoA transferase [Gammaproteobacteria bacterium]